MKYYLLLTCFCFLLAACSGSRTAQPEAPSPTPPDVPTRTNPPSNAPRTVQGFRIQILSSPEKAAADARAVEAIDWWKTVPARQRPLGLDGAELPLEIRWLQPYYRVRLGNFATRGEAERGLALVQDRYPEAFIVPDTVTVVR